MFLVARAFWILFFGLHSREEILLGAKTAGCSSKPAEVFGFPEIGPWKAQGMCGAARKGIVSGFQPPMFKVWIL